MAVAVGAAGVRGKLSTPSAIRWCAVAVVLPAIVLGIVVASVVGSLRGGFDQLSQRAAPQVAASADLYVALSDMDAQVGQLAGEALSLDPGPAGQPPPTTLAVYRQATALMPALLGDTQSLIATGEVTGWSGLLPAVVVVLIVGLLAVGVWPRLAEYRR